MEEPSHRLLRSGPNSYFRCFGPDPEVYERRLMGGAMDDRVYVVAGITVVAGLLGGSAAYLTEPVGDSAALDWRARTIARPLLLGVLAAACVPLFLSLVQSGLIKTIFPPPGTPPRPPAFEEYLIYVGLCVVAAISSRTFIDSVTRKVLQQAKEAKEIATEAKETAQQAAEEVQLGESADDAHAPRPDFVEAVGSLASPSGLQRSSEGAAEELSDEERMILQALTTRTYRTRTGIANDSGVPRNRVSELLEALADRKLALPTKSPRTGGARWFITKRGHAALG